MNTFNSAPLPFQGQKRNFIKHFRELIKNEFRAHRNGVFIDAFGGSGLLSHNIKQIYPNARVIYNDYDNYSERLANIEVTNEILQAIEPITKKYKKNEKVSGEDREKIIKNYGKGSLKDVSNLNEVHEAQLLALDVTKAKFRLNWASRWNIDKTIEKTVEWYKRYNNDDVYELCVKQIKEFIGS